MKEDLLKQTAAYFISLRKMGPAHAMQAANTLFNIYCPIRHGGFDDDRDVSEQDDVCPHEDENDASEAQAADGEDLSTAIVLYTGKEASSATPIQAEAVDTPSKLPVEEFAMEDIPVDALGRPDWHAVLKHAEGGPSLLKRIQRFAYCLNRATDRRLMPHEKLINSVQYKTPSPKATGKADNRATPSIASSSTGSDYENDPVSLSSLPRTRVAGTPYAQLAGLDGSLATSIKSALVEGEMQASSTSRPPSTVQDLSEQSTLANVDHVDGNEGSQQSPADTESDSPASSTPVQQDPNNPINLPSFVFNPAKNYSVTAQVFEFFLENPGPAHWPTNYWLDALRAIDEHKAENPPPPHPPPKRKATLRRHTSRKRVRRDSPRPDLSLVPEGPPTVEELYEHLNKGFPDNRSARYS